MSATNHPPSIPNHEILRVIGRGAYGEIWLAKNLTGSLRAVKVVHRANFESERSFLREFAGVAKFEPVSRTHDGFVDVLEVGRDEARGFFYYVMELADDANGGEGADGYTPRTLASDMARRGRIGAEECARAGAAIARGLAALHGHGLTHRDVKPSNIIFCGGVPKIADVGLVSTSGGRTFVGTEGFVPPEGPGTAQADIYALGKVLYEACMGKDRMDFPEVPTALENLPDREATLRLNAVLLKACAADPAKRYKSAQEMAGDLERVSDGARPASKSRPALWLGVVFVAVALVFTVLNWRAWFSPKATRSSVTITTNPPGAMVVFGDRMKNSPATFDAVEPGSHSLRVMLAGYEPVEKKVNVSAGGGADIPPLTLQRSHGSIVVSSRPEGAWFELRDGAKAVASGTAPVTMKSLAVGKYDATARLGEWELHDTVTVRRNELVPVQFDFDSEKLAVESEPPGAQISIDGKPRGQAPLTAELLRGTHHITAARDGWPEQAREVKLAKSQPGSVLFEFSNGSVKITSSPSGAAVWKDGVELGKAPLLLADVPPGRIEYELRLAGFDSVKVGGGVEPARQLFLAARFENPRGPQAGRPWKNSLGMEFAPVGGVLFCVWETRNQDYAAFCAATGQPVDPQKEPLKPASRVNWSDATEFCKWLTEKERADGLLADGQLYRLPADSEWSMAAGLASEQGDTPESRDGKIKAEFPWGGEWPPPAGSGNFADQTARRQLGAVIAGFNDGHGTSAPVGSFAANRFGLFDIAGNLWEWCADSYKGTAGRQDWGVLRGGSWSNATRAELLSSYRNVIDRNERDVIFGFRCVLVPGGEGRQTDVENGADAHPSPATKVAP